MSDYFFFFLGMFIHSALNWFLSKFSWATEISPESELRSAILYFIAMVAVMIYSKFEKGEDHDC